jgi:hypothetical protein
MAGQGEKKKVGSEQKLGVGEGTTGIESGTAFKQEMQRHQTPRDVQQATDVSSLDLHLFLIKKCNQVAHKSSID